ncbi:Gfo/Idh/MocA family protein [Arsenicibacter rosenii]|uniref:Oxidoreductase n=1 Tax=Arsenicibacter rosenii TaxID=1750698 RepID=A0A1S2VGX8_9BACT|nr:Gfo/Idh/MocA family oxidoreductase [Arsenicibacter rosenii]OIN57670.1 oxidoreductase [Arsenicibacter rosenii]
MTRWGILGPGRIAHKFAQDLLMVPDAELYAVASSDQARAEAFAAQYGARYAFDSYEALLTCDEVDVVYIATPHVQHYANTMMLLGGNKAVLCEKPFAMNGRQVGEMVALARSRQVFLMEALWSRFMPAILKAKALIDEGAIGKVQLLKADFGFRATFDPEGRLFNKALGGGSLLDIGIYPLFLSYLLLGIPESIKAAANIGSTGVDEQCGMALTYAGGKMALLDSTIMAKTDCIGLIYGEKGMIRIHGRFHESMAVSLELDGQEPERFDFNRKTHGYDYEIQHVGDCLAQGLTESRMWSLEDSENLMGLLDAIRQETGIVYDAD